MENALNLDQLNTREKLEAFLAARDALPMEQMIIIDGMIAEMSEKIKTKNPKIWFSSNGAMEVLAKIGIWLNESKK